MENTSSQPPQGGGQRPLSQPQHSLIAAREMFAVTPARRGLGITIHESLQIIALLEYGDDSAT